MEPLQYRIIELEREIMNTKGEVTVLRQRLEDAMEENEQLERKRVENIQQLEREGEENEELVASLQKDKSELEEKSRYAQIDIDRQSSEIGRQSLQIESVCNFDSIRVRLHLFLLSNCFIHQYSNPPH